MTSEHTPKLRFSVEEALAALGISRRHFYARVAAGSIRTVRDGRRRFVLRDDLLAAANNEYANTR